MSAEETTFTIRANSINKVRGRDIMQLVLPDSLGKREVGLNTQLDGIRVTGPQTRVGGISLFDDYKTAPITSNYWYVIPPEVPIPKGLALVKASHA